MLVKKSFGVCCSLISRNGMKWEVWLPSWQLLVYPFVFLCLEQEDCQSTARCTILAQSLASVLTLQTPRGNHTVSTGVSVGSESAALTRVVLNTLCKTLCYHSLCEHFYLGQKGSTSSGGPAKGLLCLYKSEDAGSTYLHLCVKLGCD